MTLDAQHLAEGDRIGAYTVEATIGSGGFATVYLARDTRDCKRVALKVITATTSTELDSPARRLRHEIEILQRLNHPGICRVYELGQEAGILFMAMDYAPGHTLDMEVRRLGKIPEVRLIPIIRDVCNAVAAAHSKQILHRDIKPANIVLDAKDAPTVLDFGHAIGPDISRVTALGSWVGTLQYMAPELIRNQDATIQSEVYSLGAVLYRCVSGAYPFPRCNYSDVVALKLRSGPQPLGKIVPDVLPALAAMVEKAMQTDPAARFATVGELATALHQLVSGEPLEAVPETTLVVRHRAARNGKPGAKPAPDPDPDTEPDTKPKSKAKPKPKSRAPEPPQLAFPHGKYLWYVEAIGKMRKDKGLVIGDLPEADAQERAAAFSIGEGQIDASLESLRSVLEAIVEATVDQGFIGKKIKRVDQVMRSSGGYRRMADLEPILNEVMTDFDQKHYAEANKGLNGALALLGKR